jgi:hypothetical protein
MVPALIGNESNDKCKNEKNLVEGILGIRKPIKKIECIIYNPHQQHTNKLPSRQLG